MAEDASTTGRWIDGGPIYKETPPAPIQATVAEPWNTVTASLFIVIAAMWLVRLRGRYADYPFLSCCMPILLAGGIGGDVVPCVAIVAGLLPLGFDSDFNARLARQRLSDRAFGEDCRDLESSDHQRRCHCRAGVCQWGDLSANRLCSAEYAGQPLVWFASIDDSDSVGGRADSDQFSRRRLGGGEPGKFRHCVVLSAHRRQPDGQLAMGTHWLWHVFGAITTWGFNGSISIAWNHDRGKLQS